MSGQPKLEVGQWLRPALGVATEGHEHVDYIGKTTYVVTPEAAGLDECHYGHTDGLVPSSRVVARRYTERWWLVSKAGYTHEFLTIESFVSGLYGDAEFLADIEWDYSLHIHPNGRVEMVPR